jgi:hypothetical protein
MHGDHPAGVQVEEGAGGVGGIGVNVAKRGRVVSPDRQQRKLGAEPTADLAKARKISGVAGVVDRMLSGAKDVAAVTAMRVLQNPSAPMAGGNVGHGEVVMAIAIPPIEFDDIAEAEIGDEIEDVMGDYGDWRFAPPLGLLGNGAQGWAMKVVKMGVGDEHNVDGREIAKLDSRLAQAFENEEPTREIGIDYDIFTADLEEEAGVADESDTHLPVGDKLWAVSFAGQRADGRMAHQAAKSAGALTQSRILESCL